MSKQVTNLGGFLPNFHVGGYMQNGVAVTFKCQDHADMLDAFRILECLPTVFMIMDQVSKVGFKCKFNARTA